MEKTYFEKTIKHYVHSSPENRVKKEVALRPDLEGMRIFDEPLFGYAAADDPYFNEAKRPEIIGAHFMTPDEWLAGAKTVVALFLPFTAQVRGANRLDKAWPAVEWLHARIEGQAFQDEICRFVKGLLEKESFAALSPMLDSRFNRISPTVDDKTKNAHYASNWSERHAAYATGLGTFGLSKGLITRKGVAGRYLSVITTASLAPNERPYKGVYDYCSNCGLCISTCPVEAISLEQGKLHYPCSVYIETVKGKHAPYFGCGKCQVNVPCEDKAPAGN